MIPPDPPTLDYRTPREEQSVTAGMILSRVAAGFGWLLLLLSIPACIILCAGALVTALLYQPESASLHPMRDQIIWRGIAMGVAVGAAVGIFLTFAWSSRCFHYAFAVRPPKL